MPDETREPTKRELAEALEAERARGSEKDRQIAEQAAALEELRAQAARQAAPPRPGQTHGTPKPGVQRMPYSGLVQATEPCQYGHLRAAGEIWHIDTDVLWSDDPFKPVIQTGQDRDGNPIVEPHPEAPTPLPFELRPRSADALASQSATPRRAADWH